jgi:hypothetical protein
MNKNGSERPQGGKTSAALSWLISSGTHILPETLNCQYLTLISTVHRGFGDRRGFLEQVEVFTGDSDWRILVHCFPLLSANLQSFQAATTRSMSYVTGSLVESFDRWPF